MTCSVESCEREPRRGHRMCSMHEARWQRCGDTAGSMPDLPPLPAAPLVELVESHGGIAEYGPSRAQRRAYGRAKSSGVVTVWNADALAHSLFGVHPCEVWPQWFGPYGVNV